MELSLNKILKKTPESAIQIIEEQLHGIQSVIALKNHDGWDFIAKTVVQQVRVLEKQIIGLSRQPEKNSEAIMMKVAERKALVGLLGLVDGLYRNGKVKVEKLEELYDRFMNLMNQG